MARPIKYTGSTVVKVSPDGQSKLQKGSDRRIIVDAIMENGGRMTFGEVDKAIGVPVRSKVMALVRAGWLEVVE